MADFNCNFKMSGFTLCVPPKYIAPEEHKFYLKLDSKTSDDAKFIQLLFNDNKYIPTPVSNIPEGINLASTENFYNVTTFVPSFIKKHVGGKEDYPGPNCYATSLVVAGFDKFYGRHVSPLEFRYYLSLHFKEGNEKCLNTPGNIVIYDESSLFAFDAGDHAAIILLGGLIFQKGGYDTNFPYEIVETDKAMEAVESHVKKGPFDSKLDWKIDYKKKCYTKKNEAPVFGAKNITSQKYYLPLFNYYISRFEKVMKITGGDNVRENRIDLLTIENILYLIKDFEEKEVGNINVLQKLQTLDPAVVAAYLKLESLSWQYTAQTTKYDSPKEGRTQDYYKEFSKKLYKEKYVNFNKDFLKEAQLIFSAKGVSKKDHACVLKKLVKKIKLYNPEELAQWGTKVPYFNILDNAVVECGSNQ